MDSVRGELFNTDTCFVLCLPKDTALRAEPLPLACGDVLMPGDGFTQLGRPGQAACPSVVMAAGWSQWFVGFTDWRHLDDLQPMALFKAYNTEGVDACDSYKDEHPDREVFIAYAWLADNELYPLTWMSQACSYRWAKTDLLVRADVSMIGTGAEDLKRVMDQSGNFGLSHV
ncbi:hypothetical protein [Shewanella algae]|uniref:hypothetical protein n=1 Tax=Shewanella algae TaxID=38313 RepID=UPI0031F592E6